MYHQGTTLTGLIQVAERAPAQEMDLYGQSPRAGAAIHELVRFFVDAVENPDLVLPYALANHSAKGGRRFRDYNWQSRPGRAGSTMGWIAPYVARFPDRPNVQRLRTLDLDAGDLAPEAVRAAMRRGIPLSGSG